MIFPQKGWWKMFERAQWFLVGIPRPTKISISHRCSFHQHSLLKIIQDDGVVSILTRFLDISLPTRNVWTLYFRNVETHGNGNVSCHLTGVPSISSREMSAIGNLSVYLFENLAYFSLQPDPTSSRCLSSKNACAWSGCLLFSDEFACKLLPLQTAINTRTIERTKDMAKKNMWPAQMIQIRKFGCTTLAYSMYAISFTLRTTSTPKNKQIFALLNESMFMEEGACHKPHVPSKCDKVVLLLGQCSKMDWN